MDRIVRARAELAHFLRGRKAAAGLTHEEMSKRVNGVLSKATFERAASGVCVPSWETVETFIKVTVTKEEEFAATHGVTVDRGVSCGFARVAGPGRRTTSTRRPTRASSPS
ncbi:helix-turn-helix domain-containing protein [Streptomyces sp. NPDC054794]